MSLTEFERLVEETLEDLPKQFLDLLDNIAIMVEDEPTEDDLETAEGEEDSELLGIFRGVPRTERAYDTAVVMPDQIVVFRGPILRMTSSRDEAVQEIRETVIHELGHFFGLEDDDMPY